jgi:hypothetical protein
MIIDQPQKVNKDYSESHGTDRDSLGTNLEVYSLLSLSLDGKGLEPVLSETKG